jgi:hypothetical protein
LDGVVGNFYLLINIKGLHLDDASKSRLLLARPFKLSCLYTPVCANIIIDNLMDSGFDKREFDHIPKPHLYNEVEEMQNEYYRI